MDNFEIRRDMYEKQGEKLEKKLNSWFDLEGTYVLLVGTNKTYDTTETYLIKKIDDVTFEIRECTHHNNFSSSFETLDYTYNLIMQLVFIGYDKNWINTNCNKTDYEDLNEYLDYEFKLFFS